MTRRKLDEERVQQARIDDLICGDLSPQDIDPAEPQEVREAAAWVERTVGALRAQAPDADLPRRIAAQLPIGKPAPARHFHGSRFPGGSRLALLGSAFSMRLTSAALIAAALLAALWLGSRLATQESEPGRLAIQERAQQLQPVAIHSLGTITYRDGQTHTPARPIEIRNGQEVVTVGDESATIRLSPWWVRGAPTAATMVQVDPQSKLVVQVYRFEEMPEAWLPSRDLLERTAGLEPPHAIEGPILEIQVLQGTAVVNHNGFETEMTDPDMVLLSPGLPPRKVGDEDLEAIGDHRITERNAAIIAIPEPSLQSPVGPQLCAVSGLASDADGDPLQHFTISLWWRDPGSRHGDRFTLLEVLHYGPEAEGSFRDEGLEPGSYCIGISSPAHVTQIGPLLLLEPGELPAPQLFRLQRGLEVHGRVRSAVDGRPIDGAIARARTYAYPHVWRGSDAYGLVIADERGAFSIANRARGYHSLRIEAEGHAFRYLPLIFLGSDDRDLEEIVLDEESVIHGKAFGLDGMPLMRHRVSLRSHALRHFESTRTDGRGGFRFDGLAAGTYQVSLGTTDLKARRRTLVELGEGEVQGVDLGGHSGILTGELCGADGQPLASHRVLFYEKTGEELRSRCAPTFDAMTDEHGHFRCDLTPGTTFDLHVKHSEGLWSAYAGSLQIRAGRNPWHSCKLDGAPLNGRLEDARSGAIAARRARLSLTALGDPQRRWRAWIEDGRFAFQHLPAGRYRLSGWVHNFVIVPRELTVGAADSRADLVVVCERPADVVAAILDESGNPIPLVDVHRLTESGEEIVWLRRTETGAIRKLTGLLPGRVRLVFSAPGFEPALRELDLQRDGENRIEVRLATER